MSLVALAAGRRLLQASAEQRPRRPPAGLDGLVRRIGADVAEYDQRLDAHAKRQGAEKVLSGPPVQRDPARRQRALDPIETPRSTTYRAVGCRPTLATERL